MRRFRKSLGLLAVVGGLVLAGAGSAHAAGWRGGGHVAVGGHGPAVHVAGGGWHGAAWAPPAGGEGTTSPAEAWRRAGTTGTRLPIAACPSPEPGRRGTGVTTVERGSGLAAPGPIRLSRGGSGWRPHWQWNGYQWVWQQGSWAAPTY